MDFSLDTALLALRERVITVTRKLANPGAVVRDRDAVFDRELWQKLAQNGLLGHGLPEQYSGTKQLDLISTVVALEALGYASDDNGLPFAISAHSAVVQHIINDYGNDEQKQRFLPACSNGTWIGAQAISEPDAGSDMASLKTHAKPVDGGYRLTGSKCMITLAPVADLFIVFATVNPELGKWGITLFIVPRESAGFVVSEPVDKLGLRSCPIGNLAFTDVFIPVENRIGPEGAGTSISTRSLETERVGILASQVGRMERQLEIAVDYARERRQFDQPIGSFQSVSNRIADMKLRLETTRLLLYKVAWMKANNQSAVMEAAMLKLWISEQFLESSIDAMRIHGGRSYLSENRIEHDVRDALGGILYAGTSDIQRNVIAAMLGL